MDDREKEEHKRAVFRVIDNAKEKQTREARKKEADKTRGQSRKEYYARLRMKEVAVDILVMALLDSYMSDGITKWNQEMIEELLNDIEDPGPSGPKRVRSDKTKT